MTQTNPVRRAQHSSCFPGGGQRDFLTLVWPQAPSHLPQSSHRIVCKGIKRQISPGRPRKQQTLCPLPPSSAHYGPGLFFPRTPWPWNLVQVICICQVVATPQPGTGARTGSRGGGAGQPPLPSPLATFSATLESPWVCVAAQGWLRSTLAHSGSSHFCTEGDLSLGLCKHFV